MVRPVGATAMTNRNGIAIAVLALTISLSSVGGDHRASSAEIRSLDGAGSGIAPKNIIFDDDYARYADGMAAHYILLELERAGYAKVLAMVADSSNTYSRRLWPPSTRHLAGPTSRSGTRAMPVATLSRLVAQAAAVRVTNGSITS